MTLRAVFVTYGDHHTVTVTSAHRRDPRQAALLRALSRVTPGLARGQRTGPAHAAPRSPARSLLWWIAGLGALVLLGSWLGAASMFTSGPGPVADSPRVIDSTSAAPGVGAGPTASGTTPSAGTTGGPTAGGCATGTGCEDRPVSGRTTPRSPQPARSGSPNDPHYDRCEEAKAHGYGPYVRGEDPEYGWYRLEDTDDDGVVCE